MRIGEFVTDMAFNSTGVAVGLVLVFRTEEVFRFLGMGKYKAERMTPKTIQVYQIIGIVLVLGGLQTMAYENFDFYFR